MKIATPTQLSARLDRAISWRKKELTQQKLMADSAMGANSDVLRRSGITLLYAHWEGFIKDASNYYLTYLSNMPLVVANLRSCFVAIALSGEIRRAGLAKATSVHAELVDLFRSIESPPFLQRRLRVKKVISTKSNLKSGVLREITATLGLDYTPFQLKEHAVIDRLVGFRNSIAHGQGIPISKPDYDDLHTEVIALLDKFKDLIADAATADAHVRK
jgi:hypothetical protein